MLSRISFHKFSKSKYFTLECVDQDTDNPTSKIVRRHVLCQYGGTDLSRSVWPQHNFNI